MENKIQNTTEPGTETPGVVAHESKASLANNKNVFKKAMIFVGAFALVLIVILVWQWMGSRSQNNAIAQADIALINATDSASNAKAYEMYKVVADDAGYKANERAQIITAEKLYQDGKYEEALEYLDKPAVESPVVATGIYCLKGDCYANLDKYDEAVEQFENALNEADNNPELTPYILNKLANLYHVKADYAKEIETLKRLQTEYPGYNATVQSEIARAEALTDQK